MRRFGMPLGLWYMIVSAFSFSLMGLGVKLAGARLTFHQLVFFRSLITFFLSYQALRQANIPFFGNNRKLLLMRGLAGFTGLNLTYYSIVHLPLADATVIQQTNPIFTAIFAGLFLAEHLSWKDMLGILISMVGVLCVAQPAFIFSQTPHELPLFPLLIAIGGAVVSGIAYTIIRKLSNTEHSLVTVFYFPLVSLPLSTPTAFMGWVQPTWKEWLLLLAIGICTQSGQVFLTKSLHLEPAGRATAVGYSQFLFAILWGLLLFQEMPNSWKWLGAALIFCGTLIMMHKSNATQD